MKNVFRNKIILIPVVIVLAIILLVLLINTFTNNELIKQILPDTYKQEEEEKVIEDGILCKVLDNTGEKIKGFVTIQRTEGIEKIEYTASNGKTVTLNCNNKQTVTIDTEMLVNEELQFKVTSNGQEKIETAVLNENYLDDYISITKLPDKDELNYNEATIEFNSVQDSTKYYKINQGPWTAYSQALSLDLSSVDIEKLKNYEYDTTIYAKCVDAVGNTLTTSKTIEITKYSNFDLFYNMEISGKTNPRDYAIIPTVWSGTDSAWDSFGVRYMGGGHWTGSGSFSIIITLTWNNQVTFDSINTGFLLYAEGRGSGATGGITINYVDGTSSAINTDTNTSRGTVQTYKQLAPEMNKAITSIQFRIWGYDGSGTSSNGYVNSIVFKGLRRMEDNN